jgi:hypothetical protein
MTSRKGSAIDTSLRKTIAPGNPFRAFCGSLIAVSGTRFPGWEQGDRTAANGRLQGFRDQKMSNQTTDFPRLVGVRDSFLK